MKTIALIVIITMGLSLLTIFKMDPVFTFIPIFHSSECLEIQSRNGNHENHLEYWKLTTNQASFVIVNYLELYYIVHCWMKLRKIKKDMLNIKNEFLLITLGWTVLSIIYFASV